MVKRLRRKFILTAMSALAIILAAIIGVINIANFTQITRRADGVLKILAENQGIFPMPELRLQPGAPAPGKPSGDIVSREDLLSYRRQLEAPFEARYFWVCLGQNGGAAVNAAAPPQTMDLSHIAAISENEALLYAQEVFRSGKTSGYMGAYRYLLASKGDGTTLVLFYDAASQFLNAYALLRMTLLIGFVSLLAMFLLVRLFSGRAVAPVVESLEKQKRFITDAGHELKTPLSVISANTDVLELESGANEWTRSIRRQVRRMSDLVQNMLILSRMEEETVSLVFSDFDLSDTLRKAAASFEAVAIDRQKQYTVDLTDGIYISGDQAAIQQLASLLLDNAMKYSSAQGEICVRLSREMFRGSPGARLEVSNTCDALPQGNLDRLFDRFYRADSSRSRAGGGYGIGLSAARAIVTAHGGVISAVRGDAHTIRFIALLPARA